MPDKKKTVLNLFLIIDPLPQGRHSFKSDEKQIKEHSSHRPLPPQTFRKARKNCIGLYNGHVVNLPPFLPNLKPEDRPDRHWLEFHPKRRGDNYSCHLDLFWAAFWRDHMFERGWWLHSPPT